MDAAKIHIFVQERRSTSTLKYSSNRLILGTEQCLTVNIQKLACIQTTVLTETAWLYEKTWRQSHFGFGYVNSKLRT